MFRFPWGDMHSLNLGWFLQKFNELREDWATAEAGIDGALDAEIQRAEDALSDVFDARDAAAASATAAAGSATAAGTSATAAQNSATAAASSATLANNKATAAGLSEAAAAQSATAASSSATAAAGSATTASTAATNAAASETAAGNSASAAAASAASIEGDAAAAAASAAAAAESADDAESAAQSLGNYNNLLDYLAKYYPSFFINNQTILNASANADPIALSNQVNVLSVTKSIRQALANLTGPTMNVTEYQPTPADNRCTIPLKAGTYKFVINTDKPLGAILEFRLFDKTTKTQKNFSIQIGAYESNTQVLTEDDYALLVNISRGLIGDYSEVKIKYNLVETSEPRLANLINPGFEIRTDAEKETDAEKQTGNSEE